MRSRIRKPCRGNSRYATCAIGLALLSGLFLPKLANGLVSRCGAYPSESSQETRHVASPRSNSLPAGRKLLIGYFPSWMENKSIAGPGKTALARMPGYINMVDLAFMKPDAVYAGGLSLQGTGLQFRYDGRMLKRAITTLRHRCPQTRILISVGGESYTNWGSYHPQAVARFVKDFGLDGADIDFESGNPGCGPGKDGHIHCLTDTPLLNAVRSTRRLLPRPAILSATGWSVGAYGEGAWRNAQPQSPWTGMMLALFRSPAASDLDLVNVMSYDATDRYDPKQALAAYQHYFKGRVAMGIEAPPEDVGGHVTSLAAVRDLTNAVIRRHAAGIMLWSIGKQTLQPSPANPNVQMIAQQVCRDFHLGGCSAPLPP
ncbi:MAG TPA: glycosyl hydrolase family 18 protein [Chthonomonadaceae bacterium]|nr:glycosyl hydrolase family 18 protein [Chthonomonadaceae bacterium]